MEATEKWYNWIENTFKGNHFIIPISKGGPWYKRQAMTQKQSNQGALSFTGH